MHVVEAIVCYGCYHVRMFNVLMKLQYDKLMLYNVIFVTLFSLHITSTNDCSVFTLAVCTFVVLLLL